jgi:hypothetical protein
MEFAPGPNAAAQYRQVVVEQMVALRPSMIFLSITEKTFLFVFLIWEVL